VCRIRQRFPDAEILVVDDSSSDATAAEAENAGARVVRHLYNMGNGAAIKTGARHAKGETIVFMDADGQHDDRDIAQLLEKIDEGYELVVGSRTRDSHANIGRNLGNRLLNKFASLMTGRTIPDLTSGFRAVKRDTFRQFIHLLPNGFSYPTTSTMAYFRSGYPVIFVPIRALPRKGKSKISFVRDGIRFLVVIMKVTTLFSPMRLFFPASLMFFLLGLGRYLYFYWLTGSFSSMAGVMFITAMLVFLIGLVSEQITALHYGISRSRMNGQD
ncbi:MAG: glycosyltransferase family 2 protein, partial [Candidatus Sedimenticola sp. (ex Thyasira tokunagai)]